jgi:3'-phosphoadenosine 5'-phosphosulfate sulfotransferase (PAPS reductase)/FAD synthetase
MEASVTLETKIKQSMEILDEAVGQHKPSHVFGMFSGGHDSLVATHLASKHSSFTRAAHINTTIGIEQTRQFVRDTARERQWRLLEYTPPVSYRDIVLEHGFPGPGGHRFMYTRLKERCVDRLVREHKTKWNDRIGLVTGVRLSESVRRMGHVEPVKRDGCQLWIAPILHWDDDDKLEYMAREGLKRNAVVDTICMSGECLCGAFAHKEELFELGQAFPDTAAVIHDLQAEAAARGVHCKWGTRPPGKRGKPTKGGMMCSSCNQRNGLAA